MSELRHPRVRCSSCGGTGLRYDSERLGHRVNSPPWSICTSCMEAGFVPDGTRVEERCPDCGGRGFFVDPDTLEGWPEEDATIRCEVCIGTGTRVRPMTLLEKVVGLVRLTWPPDPENPRHFADPGQAAYEAQQRTEARMRRRVVGF